MDVHVTSTQAAEGFSDLLKRVRGRGESFVVEEGGRAVCTIRPADAKKRATLAEVVAALQNGPSVDEEYCKVVEEYVNEVNRPRVPESPWDR